MDTWNHVCVSTSAFANKPKLNDNTGRFRNNFSHMDNKQLNVLMLEDNDADQALATHELKRSGINISLTCVQTEADFKRALEQSNPDLILSDYSLPQYSGIEALRVAQAMKPEIPFIIFTGTINEETAVECLKSGATDYVLKDKLFRLPSAVSRALSIKEMSLEKKQAEHDLQFSQRRLQMITDAVPALIAYVDEHLNLKFANETYEKWFQVPRDQIQGTSVREIFGQLNFEIIHPYVKQALAGTETNFNFLLNIPEGGPRHVNAVFVPEKENGQVKGYASLITDISEIKKVEERLRNKTLEAEAANVSKGRFLTNMSHEIRTPLNAVLGFAELLLSPELTVSDRQEWVAKIRTNGEHLRGIIDEILDLSKVEIDLLPANKESFLLSQITAQIDSQVFPLLNKKHLSLNFKIKGQIPDKITSDPLKLKQILVNLIGNAIKFSEKGSIDVLVENHQDQGRKQLKFSVSDEGIGVRREDVHLLFRPFTQVDNSLTRRYGGTGLGLALSHRFAESLGGHLILAESTPGKGSTFSFTIDIEPFVATSMISSFDLRQINKAQEIAWRLDDVKVLVVEDVSDNQILFERFLTKAGAKVDTAENGQEGIEKALAGHYDVILMDIQMPVLDGYEATSYLRSHGYTGPIIALTAHAMKEEKEKCIAYGCNDHLAKPVTRAELIKKIASYDRHH